jgi:hypothetical protein
VRTTPRALPNRIEKRDGRLISNDAVANKKCRAMDLQIYELSRTIISRIAQKDIHSDASNHIENIPTTLKAVMTF